MKPQPWSEYLARPSWKFPNRVNGPNGGITSRADSSINPLTQKLLRHMGHSAQPITASPSEKSVKLIQGCLSSFMLNPLSFGDARLTSSISEGWEELITTSPLLSMKAVLSLTKKSWRGSSLWPVVCGQTIRKFKKSNGSIVRHTFISQEILENERRWSEKLRRKLQIVHSSWTIPTRYHWLPVFSKTNQRLLQSMPLTFGSKPEK